MEIINIISILLIHAVAYVALQSTPTCFLNRPRKVEQVDRAASDAIFKYLSEHIPNKQKLCSADIVERKPTVGTFGKRYLQGPLKRRREHQQCVSAADEKLYDQASPTAADIWTIPSHIPKVKSARILWYLDDFIPSHPEIDSSTMNGRKKLKTIALDEEKRRKLATLPPVVLPPRPVPTPVNHHLPPLQTTTN